MNRDHFDSIRWMIISIFIAASFTLLGISFLDPVIENPFHVRFLSGLSLLLTLVWVGYDQVVQAWVEESHSRAPCIEDGLRLRVQYPTLRQYSKKTTKDKGEMDLLGLGCIIRASVCCSNGIFLKLNPTNR